MLFCIFGDINFATSIQNEHRNILTMEGRRLDGKMALFVDAVSGIGNTAVNFRFCCVLFTMLFELRYHIPAHLCFG